MVLIPEEKLIRYEKQLNDQPPTNEQAGGSIFPIHYPGGNYPGHDYLYNYPKYPGSEEAKKTAKDLCPSR